MKAFSVHPQKPGGGFGPAQSQHATMRTAMNMADTMSRKTGIHHQAFQHSHIASKKAPVQQANRGVGGRSVNFAIGKKKAKILTPKRFKL